MANIGAVRQFYRLWEEPQFLPLPVPGLRTVFDKGLARGAISEIHGRRSSGRTAACLHILAQATRCGEVCAVIDLYDSFHPASAMATGVRLDRLVWVRCRGNAEHAMRAADLLLHAGGFGVVWIDLCEANPRILNRIPLSYWYRFRRAVEHTPSLLLLCGESPQAKSCSTNSLELTSKALHWSGTTGSRLFRGWDSTAILRKPPGICPEPLAFREVA